MAKHILSVPRGSGRRCDFLVAVSLSFFLSFSLSIVCVMGFDMGVDIGAGAGVDRGSGGSWEEGQVDGMDSDVGMECFQREALVGGRWLYGLLKGV